MSYKRLNQCLRVLGEPDRLIAVVLDPDTCEMLVKVCLAPNPATCFEYELDETEISTDDYDKILKWVQGHLTHFFMKRFQQLSESAKEMEPLAERLKSSLLGSANSTSSGPVAGPST